MSTNPSSHCLRFDHYARACARGWTEFLAGEYDAQKATAIERISVGGSDGSQLMLDCLFIRIGTKRTQVPYGLVVEDDAGPFEFPSHQEALYDCGALLQLAKTLSGRPLDDASGDEGRIARGEERLHHLFESLRLYELMDVGLDWAHASALSQTAQSLAALGFTLSPQLELSVKFERRADVESLEEATKRLRDYLRPLSDAHRAAVVALMFADPSLRATFS
jgi:hypothetical protein